MKFNQREWVTDIATKAITGAFTGAIGAMFVPNPPYAMAILCGGLLGLLLGLVELPVKWVLERRPGEDDHERK